MLIDELDDYIIKVVKFLNDANTPAGTPELLTIEYIYVEFIKPANTLPITVIVD